ncbi:TPA: hypothetical protein ACH3X2_007622 [Trebouxia sp. C0005]
MGSSQIDMCLVVSNSVVSLLRQLLMPGEPDYLRMAELQPFLPTALYEDELPDYIQQRRNKDLLAPGSQTWSPELLGFCQQADLLMLNGRALEDEYGQFTFQHAKGCCSTIDYYAASAQCFSAVKSVRVLDEAARYRSDHNFLLLHIAYKAPCDIHTHTSSAASDARSRCDVQKAEAYKCVLQLSCSYISFHSFSQSIHDADVLCDRLEACVTSAAQNTTLQACKRDCMHSCKHQPCFDSNCREALGLKEAVYKNPHSTAAGKDVAKKKRLQSVTDRVKETWTQKRNVELCELATKDPSQFWKAYKATQSNACLVELSAQFEAFRALMGDEHQLAPQRSGITVSSVFAKMFAMVLEQRIAFWPQEHAVKAKGQAGFKIEFRMTNNIFILRSVIDK